MPRLKGTARRPRNSIKDRPGRASLLLRRVRARSHLFLLAGALLVGIIALSALVHAHASPDGLASLRHRVGDVAAVAGFRIRRVVIHGENHTRDAAILAALGVHQGDPTLGFSLARARQRLERLAWVKRATIERLFPGTIVVRVVEKHPFALWQHGTNFSVIDRAGQVVAARHLGNFRNLPLVVGPGAPERTAALFDALKRLPSVGQKVAAAVRVGERRWNLLLKDGTTVELPDGHAGVALARLAELEATHALLDRPLAVVDMRLPSELVIRPWPKRDASAEGAAKEPG